MGEVELTWKLIDKASWSIFRIGAAFSWASASVDRMTIAELRLLNAQERLAGAQERLTHIDFRIADITDRIGYAQADLATATTEYFNAMGRVIKDQQELDRLMAESAGIREQLTTAEQNLIDAQRVYNYLIATGQENTVEFQQASEALTKARAAYNLVLSYARPYLEAIDEAQRRLLEDQRELEHWERERLQAERQLEVLNKQLTEATWTREAAERSELVAQTNLLINQERLSMQYGQMIGECATFFAMLPSGISNLYSLGKGVAFAAKEAGGFAPLLKLVGSNALGAVGGISGLTYSIASFGVILAPIGAALWMFISGLEYIKKFGAAKFVMETLGEMGEVFPDVRRGQYGYHGVVTRPTMFLAGEAGAEEVLITPRGQRTTGVVMDNRLTINIGKITDDTDVNDLLGKIDRQYRRAILTLGGSIR